MLRVIVPFVSAVAIAAAPPPPGQDRAIAPQLPIASDVPGAPLPPSSPAPVPDLQVQAPSSPAQTGLRVAPTFLPLRDPTASEGYLPGSSIEDIEQQDETPTPALDLHAPLE